MAATLVGGAFFCASIQTMMDKLTSTDFRDYINKKLNVSLLAKLETTLLTLQVVLDDAELKQINNPAVKQWLDQLKDAIFDAEDLLNEISYDSLRSKVENTEAENQTNQVWNFFSSPFNSFYRAINSQMEIICQKLQLFANQRDILGLQTITGRVSCRTPSSSIVNESVMVGRKDDKKKLLNMLLSHRDTNNNNIGVVAIVGMGGVGKTTLAQLLYNNKEVQEHFDLKAWACVSEDFDILRVTKTLLESITSRAWESNNLDFLRVELKKNSREKTFLFVLDDLWNGNYNDWDELVSPFIDGKSGSTVIITTRQQKVAEMAHTFPIHQLEPLSDEESWSLLSKHALGSDNFLGNKYSNLEAIGTKIAKKCGGLPIAAKTLGGLLRSKVDAKEWTAILNSDIWNLRNDNILPALHLSYEYLPSHLKICFTYCSLFPKDYPLVREKLVLMWMAEGFLNYPLRGKAAEEVGDECIAELLSRSLIQQENGAANSKIFYMHDLVNDLATVVSGKSFCRFECGDISENVRHLSYIQEEYDIFMKVKNFNNSKCLRSFRCIDYSMIFNYLSVKLVNDFLPTLKRLRVLSLSKYTNITKLPDSIGNLVQLRYLDLSYTKIKSLPDTTCNLYNLQSLILSYCYVLTELPMHMGNLISLRHLDISETRIKELPVEIGGLENLQTLSVFLVGKRHVGLSIKELRKFPKLKGKLTIKNLHNVVDATEAEDANLKSKEKIEELELLWGKQSEDSQKVKFVLNMLQPPKTLKSLNIDLYGGTSFPSWLGDLSFSNMVSLCISNCEYCLTLPPLGQLPSLKDLTIKDMSIMETIGPEFYCVQGGEGSNSCFQPFPSLELMKFQKMPNLKEWIPFKGSNFPFPHLKVMKLLSCRKLKGYLPINLSSLEEFEINNCVNLLETPSTLHWLSSIKKIEIDESSLCFQSVPIERCDRLLSFPKKILSRTCLHHLDLYNILSIIELPTDGLSTSLQLLRIINCENLSFPPLEKWRNYTSLVSIYLSHSCDELTSFPLDGFPMLKSLGMIGCKCLDSIFISESFSHQPPSLRSLEIRTPYSIESFKVKLRMDTLTSLEHLAFECQELSFCEGVCLPPKLRSIEIWSQRIMLPVSECGLQGLNALSSLSIGGNDIFNTLLKVSLLPISLVFLTLSDLFKMKSLEGNGLKHLSSLETLHFLNCPELQSLPENTIPSSLKSLKFEVCPKLESSPKDKFPSLKSLEFGYCERLESLPEDSLPDSLKLLVIRRCPLLEERYKREEHWSKIAWIPVIKINDQVII